MTPSVIFKYNPDQIPAKELAETFVAREGILNSILLDLRARKNSKSNQHHLIIGQRGIGKTNLVLMIRNKVLDDDELKSAYTTIRSAEEEYGITNLGDFFIKIIQLINEENTFCFEDELNLLESEKNEEVRREKAINFVKKYSENKNKKILFIIENINLILGDQINNYAEIARLRDILMNETFLVLIGTAPSFFREVEGYDKPLYNFFKVTELEDLSQENIITLFKKRAKWEGNDKLIDRLPELSPRIKAVYHLTGGNPRLVLTLYQLITKSRLPEVQSALRSLLDEITPYYKHRLESLSAQERKVLVAFAEFGRPATPTEIANKTNIAVNQINSILKRLSSKSFVQIAPQKRRKSTLYMVSERIFRIWHQMRYSAQGRKRLKFLIDFIRIWYSKNEWTSEVGRLKECYIESISNHDDDLNRLIEHLGYMAEGAPSEKLKYSAENEIVESCIEAKNFQHAEKVLYDSVNKLDPALDYEILADKWFYFAIVYNAQDKENEFNEAVEKSKSYLLTTIDSLSQRNESSRLSHKWIQLSILYDLINKRDELLQAIENAVLCDKNNYLAYHNWGEAISEKASSSKGSTRRKLLYLAKEKFSKALKIKPDHYLSSFNLGNVLISISKFYRREEKIKYLEKAVYSYKNALDNNKEFTSAQYNLGNAFMALASHKFDNERELLYVKAKNCYEKVLSIHKDWYEPTNNYGLAIIKSTNKFAQKSKRKKNTNMAIKAFNEAVKIDVTRHEAILNLGSAYVEYSELVKKENKLKYLTKAYEIYESGLNLSDKDIILNGIVRIVDLLARGKYESVLEDYYKKANKYIKKEIEINDDLKYLLLGRLYIAMARFYSGRKKIYNLKKAIEMLSEDGVITERNQKMMVSLGVAYAMLAGERKGNIKKNLLKKAFNSFEKSNQYESGHFLSLYNLGRVMYDMAENESKTKSIDYLKLSISYYSEAKEINRFKEEVMVGIGNSLLEIALQSDRNDKKKYLNKALLQYDEAKDVAKKKNDIDEVEHCIFHRLIVLAYLAQVSLNDENYGDTKEIFDEIIEYIPQIRIDLVQRVLVLFFTDSLDKNTADVCSELLLKIQKKSFFNEEEFLLPFQYAIDYWLNNNNEEILDRLNPELREIVEQIIFAKNSKFLTQGHHKC